MSDSGSLTVVGWRERVDLPEWGLKRVRAKIDTGARTSAIDVAQIEELGDGRIRFEVVARTKPERRTRWITAEPARTTLVRPSHGKAHKRVVCSTRVRIGDHEQEIELGLVCRKNMLCRMLIGRTALEGRFLVDSSRKYVATGKKRGAKTVKGATG